MTDITKIPTEDFPLNYYRYNHLMDEIRDAARGFDRLDGMGWPSAKDIDRRLMKIHTALNDVWDTIQETERKMAGRIKTSAQ